MYCNPCSITEHLQTTTEKKTYLCTPTPDLTEQLHTTEKIIHLYIATPNLAEKHPGTTPEKSTYLCVSFPWYDWRTSQYNTWDVSVPVYCLPLFPRSHCRSVSASRWPSRRSLHLGWQTNWWRQDSLKETDQKKAIFIKRYFHLKKTNRRKR